MPSNSSIVFININCYFTNAMYINFLNDRQKLGFPTIKDIEAGNKVSIFFRVAGVCIVITFSGINEQSLAPCASVMFPIEIHRSYNATQYSGDRTKKASGGSSIFVKAFQVLVNDPGRLKSIEVYDSKEGVELRPSVMLQAIGNCSQENYKLPRQITNDDKGVQFRCELIS